MSGYLQSCTFSHQRLGIVKVMVQRNMRSIALSWRADCLVAKMPPGVPVDYFMQLLEANTDKLLAARSSLTWRGEQIAAGGQLTVGSATVRFEHGDCHGSHPAELLRDRTDPKLYIFRLSQQYQYGSTEAVTLIRRLVMRLAYLEMLAKLRTHIMPIAERLGVTVKAWRVGRGRGQLGRCTADHIITISCYCIFLPDRLLDFVVCHELAHISHPDHSAAFHECCNRYCDGQEKQLHRELKAYAFPI